VSSKLGAIQYIIDPTSEVDNTIAESEGLRYVSGRDCLAETIKNLLANKVSFLEG
jgi:hypothetical protein